MLKKNAEHIAQISNKNIAAVNEVIQTSLESIEKLAKIQLDTSKKILDDTSMSLKAICQVNNPQDFFEKMNKLVFNSVENNMSNCRNVYEIMTTVQAKMGKIYAVQYETFKQD